MRACKALFLTVPAVLLPVSLWAAPAASSDRPAISPSVVEVAPGASKQFQVEIGGHRAASVSWSVNDIPGGNATLGRITAAGLYTAPASAPSPHEIHIVAEIRQPRKLKAWATVLMSNGAPKYDLVASWGEKGTGPGKFIDPHSVCIDKDGNLIIVDANGNGVFRYTKSGKYLGEIGSGLGSGPGQFKNPRDVKIDEAGNIFISDGNNQRIQVFSPSGKLLRAFGHKGTAPGEFLRVHAIWFGTKGRLYAADVDNSRIMVFTHAGKLLFEWGKDGRKPGEFHAPHGLGGDANGDLFVSNYWGPCQKFTGDGKFLFEFAPATDTGFNHWHSMTSDRWGNAYLMSRDIQNRNAIVKYNNNGALVTSWPPLRSQKEWGVKAATVDTNGTIYVAVESKAHTGIEVYRER